MKSRLLHARHRRFLLFVKGTQTEPNYFNFFAGLSSNLAVIPIPSENGKSAPVKLMEWAQVHMKEGKNAPEYKEHDLVWFVVDTDEWQKMGMIATLRNFCSLMNQEQKNENTDIKPYDMWNVAQSNPQFEIWHYFHIYNTLPIQEEVSQYTSFKEYVNSKIHGGFDFKVHPVYFEDAIKHASEHFTKDTNGDPSLYSTEVYLLCQEMLPFVKKIVDVMKRKVAL